jgi:hypothetical protein
MKKVVILNKELMKNKELVRQFKIGGFKVIRDKKVK